MPFKRSLPSAESERDVPRLLELNNTLASLSNRLRVHEKTLRRLDADLLKRTTSVLAQAQRQIEEILTQRRTGAKGRVRRIEQALSAQRDAPKAAELLLLTERPASLTDALSAAGIDISPTLRQVLRYVDDELRQRMPKEDYSGLISSIDIPISRTMAWSVPFGTSPGWLGTGKVRSFSAR